MRIKPNTQKGRILEALLNGDHITELTGLSKGFGTSMRSRISELRESMEILDYRTTGTYKTYYMEEDERNRVKGMMK